MHTPTDDGDQFLLPLQPEFNRADSEPPLPPPPSPSADESFVPHISSPTKEFKDPGSVSPGDNVDIFKMSVLAALNLLCAMMEALIKTTGDVAQTPPVTAVQAPRPRVIPSGTENQPPHSKSSSVGRPKSQPPAPKVWNSAESVPERAKTPIGSPEAKPTEPWLVVGADPDPLDVQHAAIAKRFNSRAPPPIPLKEYLLRLQKWCPTSTGVYLAAGFYVYQLAVVQRSVPVTVRNIHRLLLAALRVAGKAVNDINYHHTKFARVGGVTEPELGRLEIALCFLMDFDLRVTAEMLQEHVRAATDTIYRAHAQEAIKFRLKMPPLSTQRSTAAGLISKEAAEASTKAPSSA
ncbi:MAG: hypothetical protein Q9166_005681 [cf. Caloplaca sp. 2 TL-2023]